MTNDIYGTIPMKMDTKDRLTKFKITDGEYWDDLVNRLLDELEKYRKETKEC